MWNASGGGTLGRRWAAAPTVQRLLPDPGRRSAPAVDIRGSSGGQIAILEAETGRLLVPARARRPRRYIPARSICIRATATSSTRWISRTAWRSCTRRPGLHHLRPRADRHRGHRPGERKTYGPVTIGLVPVSVTNTVIGYLRRRLDGEVIDFVELDMPTRTLDTTAVMCTVTGSVAAQRYRTLRIPGVARRRARGDRAAAAGRQLRPRRYRRGVDGGGLRWMVFRPSSSTTASRRSRIRRPRLSEDRHMVGRRRRGDRGLRMPARLPVVQSPKCGSGNDPLDKRGRFGCCVWCSASCESLCREHGGDRPLDGRLPRISGLRAGSGTPNTQTVAKNGRTTRSVLNPGNRAQRKIPRRRVSATYSYVAATSARPFSSKNVRIS